MMPTAARTAAPALLRAPLTLALSALGTSVLFLCFMWAQTGGRFVAQTVDLYLVCQYAKAIAEGHPFQYYAGDPATTGATSLLHTAALAAAHKVGLRGEGLVAFAILTGALLLVASTDLARRLGTRLGGERTGWLAGLLVALGGPVAWGFLYGSDVALFMALALWLLLELASGWPEARVGSVALAGVLISLTRPEGLLIAATLCVAFLRAPTARRDAAGRVLACAPLLAAAGMLALNRAVTGSWLGTSVADKSLVDTYGIAEGLALVAEFLVDVLRGLLLGFYPSQAPIGFGRGWASLFFPPAGLLLVLLALVRSPHAPGLRLWAAIVGLVWVLLAPNMFMGTHFNRYLLWAFPGLLVLAAAGLHSLSGLLARGDARLDRNLFGAGSLLLLVLGGLSTLRFAVTYGDLAGQVARRDLAAAEWIRRELPPGAVVANLATSVEYLTGHRSLNLHGVTTAAFLGNRPAEREAGVLESLARLPATDRPPLLMATESALLASPALRELTIEPPLFRTSSFSDEIVVLRMQYGPLDGNDEPRRPETLEAVRGLARVDRLNVCDPSDESGHAYRVRTEAAGIRLAGTARVAAYPPADGGGRRMADAGRAVLGHERFEVATIPGRDLLIVLRTADAAQANVWRSGGAAAFDLEFPEAAIALRVRGQPLGAATFRPRPGWDELLMKVDASRISGTRTSIGSRGRYAAFRYWFYQ